MDSIVFACPSCKSLNKLPKKEEYKKAICGNCKSNLLENQPIEISSEEEFNKLANNVTVPIIIDFWAEWCAPCKMFAPTFKSVAKEFPLKAQFVKIDTELLPSIAARFGIRSIPTTVAIKNNQEIDRALGALDEFSFAMWVDKLVN